MTPESFMKLEYQHPPIKFYWNIVLLICFVLSIATFMVFPIVLYPCENWTIKKSEHQRTDAFKLWCWIRLLRVPWTIKRSDQSILKEINLEYSLEGLSSNTLPIWCEELTHWKRPCCRGKLRTGGEVGDRGWDGWMASPTQWTWVSANSRR